jgi:tetraacyldisaccharide 4'-kinase
VAGARRIGDGPRDFSVIIMDDGLQNPGLAKNLSFAVVDGQRGFGNGQVIPAGPLRARLHVQYTWADAIIVNHGSAPPENSAVATHLRADFTGPVLDASLTTANPDEWRGKPVVAYAGIGAPERFFTTLRTLGADVRSTVALPDHHVFTGADAGRLLGLARTHGATLVTTEKDKVRLAGGETGATAVAGVLAELDATSRVLAVAMTLSERDAGRLDPLLAALFAGRTRAAPQGPTS